MNYVGTGLDAFKHIPASLEAVKCGDETWTYGELDVISSGVALSLGQKFGPRPVVAVVSENHPYVLALLLATWKLGGIFAPVDQHVPPKLLQAMLLNMKPTVLFCSSASGVAKSIASRLHLAWRDVPPSAMTTLCQQFLHCTAELPANFDLPPAPRDIALYIHTSSATSVSNIKCVPLSHESILTNVQSQLCWSQAMFPEDSFGNLRVLGWSPWTHIMGISHDIFGMIMTQGTYIFATIPSTYESFSNKPGDAWSCIIDVIIQERPTLFAGVPWFLDKLRTTWLSEGNSARRRALSSALRNFKLFICGGASTSEVNMAWARERQLRLILGIGMTEFGGPLFHALPDQINKGWSAKHTFLPDAKLTLDSDDNEQEGELVITSRFICRGYLNHPSSSFSVLPDGQVTLHTGDIYRRTTDENLLWRGRREDFILMISGEIMDPRTAEASIDASPFVGRSCVVGNNFIRAPADFVCLIVQLSEGTRDVTAANRDITRTVASLNRTLPPPLRIAWSRAFILPKGQQIPLSGKGVILRKKLEDELGVQLCQKLNESDGPGLATRSPVSWSEDEAEDIILNVLAECLRLSRGQLQSNLELSFAELGMNSAMATTIVAKLNKSLSLELPANICHVHIDFVALKAAIFETIGLMSRSIDRSPNFESKTHLYEDVVIVGQAFRLPGHLNDVKSFWQALVEKRTDILTPVPPERWDHSSFYRPPPASKLDPGDIIFSKAGFIDYRSFDNSFFGITHAEAMSISPANRLTLEVAFEALENANIPASSIKGTDTGVFVACGLDEGYEVLLHSTYGYAAYSRYFGTGIANSTVSGRLSYLLDVHGPSITSETACSGGLVALDLAFKYLQSGEGESAIVAGVNVHPWPGSYSFISAQGMVSPNSRCATFTDMADGYVPAEAAVALILKTKSAAVRDGDSILAVVKATDTFHNGRTQGLVAPSSKVQSKLQRSLLRKASLSPSDIDLIETHGTGTALGDLIEIQAINDVFGSSHTTAGPLIIGAAKPCVGHTETAAGLVGVVKTIASFSHQLVPGLTHLTPTNLSPGIDCTAVPLLIPDQTVDLQPSSSVPRALVLAYGFAGTIAGLVLEGPSREQQLGLSHALPENMLFVVSAKTSHALTSYLQTYLAYCETSPPENFHSICYTSCISRDHYHHRFACVAKDMDDLILHIKERLTSSESSDRSIVNPGVVIGLPGQGTQHLGMARELASEYSGFSSIVNDAAERATNYAGFPVASFLIGTGYSSRTIEESEVSQVCIFVYQYSLCRWLESLGLSAGALLGHSLGEITAGVVSGAISFELGLRFIVKRAQLLRANPDRPAGMAAVASREQTIKEYIANLALEDHLVIAVFNDLESHVVSGDLQALDTFISALKRDGIRVTKLNVDQAFHSPCIEDALPTMKTWLEANEVSSSGMTSIPIFSTTLGRKISRHQSLAANHWIDHARNPVRLRDAIIHVRDDPQLDIIVDIGPQKALWTALQAQASDMIILTASAKHNGDPKRTLLECLARLFEHNVDLNLASLLRQQSINFSRVTIPTYPFQRQLFYPSFIPSRNAISQRPSINEQKFPMDQRFFEFLQDHLIHGRRVVPGAALVLFAALAKRNVTRSVAHVQFHQPLVIDTPDVDVRIKTDSNGIFTVSQDDTKVCSGVAALSGPPPPFKQFSVDTLPSKIMSRTEVYQSFTTVEFGRSFQMITGIHIWSDHADALITVRPSKYPEYDYIRKLDACFHMFGGLVSHIMSKNSGFDMSAGSFLPSSVEGFILYVEALPTFFTCRYHFPVQWERDHRVISAQFDVLSRGGNLLASCKRYTVAWLPNGTVVSQSIIPSIQWLKTGWAPRLLPISTSIRASGVLVYLRWNEQTIMPGNILQTIAWKFPSLYQDSAFSDLNNTITSARFAGKDIHLVLDLLVEPSPTSAIFTTVWKQSLGLMKAFMAGKVKFTSFVVVSHNVSSPGPQSSTPSTIGSIVQGLLRVFRHEIGMENVVWGIDLPPWVSDAEKVGIVEKEVIARQGGSRDSLICYRRSQPDELLERVVPILQIEEVQGNSRRMSGLAVIAGMGSIGCALAPAMLDAGAESVVFLGRRSEEDPSVAKELALIEKKGISYMQVDISELDSLRNAFDEIQSRHKAAITCIIHCAAVIQDATIASVTNDVFESVLRPKVLGAWNLHALCEERDLKIHHFVLLSSISVPLGNAGQGAYVAANSFLDSLATYRKSKGLPGLSLQLGAWESKLMKERKLDEGLVVPVQHRDGIPLIMKALLNSSLSPIQVIASLATEKLSNVRSLAEDSLFMEILKERKESTLSVATAEQVHTIIVSSLRVVLELKPEEYLDLEEPLTSVGVDSIAFAQVRGRVHQELGIEIPMKYLAETFKISDMISYVESAV